MGLEERLERVRVLASRVSHIRCEDTGVDKEVHKKLEKVLQRIEKGYKI